MTDSEKLLKEAVKTLQSKAKCQEQRITALEKQDGKQETKKRNGKKR